MITRRDFAITAGTVGVLASLPACLFSNIYKTISTYVPVALLAFDRIIAILVEHNVSVTGLTDAINAVKAALADILSTVVEFQEAHGDQKPTKMEAVRIALLLAHARLDEFWDRLQIPNQQLAVTVKALLAIIISTLAGFEMQLRPGGTAPVHGKNFITPKARSLREFREDFNRELELSGESKFAI